MNSHLIFIYVLKTTLIAGIFLGYYWFVLRNKKLHYYNRFYLLFSLILSIIIPLLTFTWITVDKSLNYGVGQVLNYIVNPGGTLVEPGWSWIDWTLASSAIIAIGFLLNLVINITKIYRIKRNSVVTKMAGFDFINTEEDDAPFSYLKNLFWKRSISLDQEDGRKIFKHELTHIQQKHTLDRLFCQLLCSVMWVNPFYWIIKKELLTIHEFIADEQAIDDSDTESFARMLLRAHFGNHFLQQTQSFFYSSIKRRLIMLTTSKNIRYSYARRLIALPLLMLTLAAFSLQVNAGAENIKLPVLSVVNKEEPNKISAPSQQPAKFIGGAAGWQKFLQATINRNVIVDKGGPPGKYAVKLSFIVDKEGDVRDVKALNDPGYGSKEDAMRVLLSSPKWIPAELNGKKVVYRNTITITYMISEE